MRGKQGFLRFSKKLIQTKMINKSVIYKPINRLFIANRGEIVLRIHQTAKEMGITTIGVVTKLEKQTHRKSVA